MTVTHITIEPNVNPYLKKQGIQFTVYQNGTYESYSVLAGQQFKQAVGFFNTLQEAKEKFPEAEVLDYNTGKPHTYLPKEPPDWFDPLNAGERWDEDY